MSVSVKDRDISTERTSSGAAEYSVLGSFASSRASCMMRLTADHERCDMSATPERRKKSRVNTGGSPELFLFSRRGTAI